MQGIEIKDKVNTERPSMALMVAMVPSWRLRMKLNANASQCGDQSDKIR